MLGAIYTDAAWIDPSGRYHSVRPLGHDDFVRDEFPSLDPSLEAMKAGWIKIQETEFEIIVMVMPGVKLKAAHRLAAFLHGEKMLIVNFQECPDRLSLRRFLDRHLCESSACV